LTHPRGRAWQNVAIALPLIFTLCIAASSQAGADAKSELRFQQGVAVFGAREFGAAREAFEAYLTRNPDDPTTLRYLGLISRYEDKDREAVDYFTRALSLAPTDVLTWVALAETLLKAEQNVPAQSALKTALTLAPQHARLHLYMGIAEYRLRNLPEAIKELERAASLDSDVEREARYYIGLSQAILGNLYASAQAFTEVAESSPAHPLGRSARNLRAAMEPETPEQRWTVSATTGFEFDTNPSAAADILDPDSDFAGSFGVRGLYDVYRGSGFTVRGGYDGFLLKRVDEERVDEQTHVAKAAVFYDYRDVRLSLRYDGSFTLLDLTDKFRLMHVIEPAANLRVGRWGITQGFYQLHRFDYYIDSAEPELDLDGFQHSLGVNQIFIPREPFTHIRAGFLWTQRDTDGDEFAHQSFGVNLGAGVLMPWYDIEVSALYRFSHLRFENGSQFPKNGTPFESNDDVGVKRKEDVHELTFNVNVPLWSRLSMDVAGAFVFNDSDIEIFRYDRQIVGAYFTWDFGGKPRRTTPSDIDQIEDIEEQEGRFPGE